MHSGTRIGPYEIASSIGAGGMGEVFRARDTRLNRDVAVKVLPKDFVADADRLRRFEQEAKTLAVLNHPNVLTVFDAGVHEGAPFLVVTCFDPFHPRKRDPGEKGATERRNSKCGLLLRAYFLVQPRPGEGPKALGRPWRDPQHLTGFLYRHSHEISEFNQFSLLWVKFGELFEGVVHGKDLLLILNGG